MPSTLVVYLHGFRSSPRSSKAVLTGDAIKALSTANNPMEWYCPQLLASPKDSMDMVIRHIEASTHDRLVVIGSSLGGYYTNYLAEKFGCKAVALNPAVRAPKELAPHVGMLTSYDTNEPYDFRPEYIDELKALQVESISNPSRYFLIAAKGDELLDWQEMVDFYKGAEQLVLEGGDHGISDYPNHLPKVINFIS
ncbi:YqiA/YcfP family alpha/beta fold hydrolase [Polynucleobacter sp. AP-Nickl1-40-C4]|uniref:YqiA/YcfP family alpha/beta fold hydrolase n=1 Tax=Polynucleobacter sp. AP-Nickl1-40-C4 TaxID=3108275 RepID=UPI002B22E611|nr:YqiA/YcfP family alpha/beta fold hydrolase [Polynucleobacter sp. AP-Nickl1-40-C4]MEA9567669.1 YqiA/YcfP family alpha/beta fold hydrolase [Polynucleobacter sp. AP-Nickl1-40-C4]